MIQSKIFIQLFKIKLSNDSAHCRVLKLLVAVSPECSWGAHADVLFYQKIECFQPNHRFKYTTRNRIFRQTIDDKNFDLYYWELLGYKVCFHKSEFIVTEFIAPYFVSYSLAAVVTLNVLYRQQVYNPTVVTNFSARLVNSKSNTTRLHEHC